MQEKAVGPDDLGVASTLNNLAVLYQEQGRNADAEPLHKRALEIREKALGPDHPYVLASVTNLAELYRMLGRQADADAMAKRAQDIRAKTK
jgi:tetratricopeptide (TPR) repeat protein